MVAEDPGPAVMVENLSVSFGKVRALAGIDLSVERGEVYGVVGTNGAGKSTLIDVLSGMVKPSSGKVSVLGLDPVHNAGELRRTVGVIPQETSIEDRLSACENLRYFGRLLDVPPEELEDRTEELVRFMGLWERRNDRLESYSVGMKRKIHFACSLMHRPRLLLVDEATAGFDPRIKREVNTLILEMSRKQGVTVLLTTHDLSDARTICDRLAVLHRGSLVCQGTWADLSSGAEAKLVLTGIPPGEEERVSRLLPGEVKESAGRFSVTVSSTSVAFELAEKLERNGIAASSISYEVPAGELFETLTSSAEEEPLDD